MGPQIESRTWPWRLRRSRVTTALAALPFALALAWPAAPVYAQAAPAASTCLLGLVCTGSSGGSGTTSTPSSNCLLGLVGCTGSGTPTSTCLLGLVGCNSPGTGTGTTTPATGPCLLGVVLCNGNLIAQPTPCVGGVLLCGPLPASPCVAGTLLCQGTIVGPNPTPNPTTPANPPATGGGNPGTASAASAGGSTAPQVLTAALAAPPGIGLVPLSATGGAANPNLNPDTLSELLSLSIRDGLTPSGYQFWPWLALLQALLLFVIVGRFSARRVLQASTRPKR